MFQHVWQMCTEPLASRALLKRLLKTTRYFFDTATRLTPPPTLATFWLLLVFGLWLEAQLCCMMHHAWLAMQPGGSGKGIRDAFTDKNQAQVKKDRGIENCQII